MVAMGMTTPMFTSSHSCTVSISVTTARLPVSFRSFIMDQKFAIQGGTTDATVTMIAAKAMTARFRCYFVGRSDHL
jgi:hypothetical protein